MKVKNTFIILLFLALLPKSTFSQVTANFTVNESEGCPPMIVTFTNQSTTGPSIKYDWNLGLGSHVYIKNPQATYTIPKPYIVTLTVTDTVSMASASHSDTLTVFHNPSANFSANQKGCVPYNALFTDLSVNGDAAITSWLWDFREGTTDTRQNPNYIYTNAGTHDVLLTVTDANGCTGYLERKNYIDVANPPVAGFTASLSTACKIPTTVTFTNTSTGSGLTYLWTFGDSKSSTLKNPTNIYTLFGNFTVKLAAKSDYGCNDSATTIIKIQPITAQGTLKQSGTTIINNAIICPGIVAYSSTSTGTSSVKWVFGDGGTSTSASGTHSYSTGGNYKALLIASPGNNCADTISWNFTVETLTANFSMSTTSSCQSPLNVTFTDQSTNAVSWVWIFDGGGSATTKNTTHIYSVPSKTDPYMINIEYTFNTILNITSPHGCTASTSKTLRIKKPTAIHSIDTSSGCKPLRVKFSDVSLSDLSVTTRKWLFGDGQVQTTSSDTTSHVFNTDGVYNTKLFITNSAGCTDTSYAIVVKVGKTLNPDFTVSNSNPCPNEEIQFTDETPQASLIQSWRYFVDNATINNNPSDPNPYWIVKSDTGYLDVKLFVNYNGCISETTKPKFLFNKGPVADFSYSFSCNTPFNYSFTNEAKSGVSYEWNFGDGTALNTNENPNHNYSLEGDYNVEQVVTKNSCQDTSRKEVKVRNPNTIITANVNSCKATPVYLSGKSSYSLVDYCYEKYFWDFGGIAPNVFTNSDSVNVSFPNRGSFNVKLFTYYDNGCLDSAIKLIHIYQPYVNISADTSFGCSPIDVSFTDSSYADTYPLTRWSWNFNDGTSNLVYTSYTNPIPHTFENPGEYNVTLTVRDGLGCEGTDTSKIATANPDATFTSPDPKGCTNENVSFQYSYLSPDSAFWNFGDGSIVHSINNPISHVYKNRGTYPVELILFKYACPDTFTSPANYVEIQKADANFNVSDSAWNCYPKKITFSHHSIDTLNTNLSKWEFGYNNNVGAYKDTVIFTYPLPGQYSPRLMIETQFGCKDTASRSITITGPTGTYNISPDTACSGDLIKFNLSDTNHVFGFEWDMGNGDFKQGNPVQYTYPLSTSGNVYPKLILFGDSIYNSTNVCVVAIEDTLLISLIKADFGYTDTALCDKNNIYFHNNSEGNTINNWDFGNGTTSNLQDPVEKFIPGTYTAILIAINKYNCSDTAEKSFTIHPLPAIYLSNDTFICFGNSIVLHASGGDAITWNPAAGLNNVHSYNPTANPSNTTIYKAHIVDLINNCWNTDSLRTLCPARIEC